MSVTASKANPAVGEEFSIYLNASGDIAECGCFQMDLYYDQDLFEYVGANTAFTPNHNTNKTTGARYIRLTWLDLTSQTVIPKGQFCELKFKVLKAGEYHFQLTNIVISDYKGDAIMNVATAPGSVDVAVDESGDRVSALECDDLQSRFPDKCGGPSCGDDLVPVAEDGAGRDVFVRGQAVVCQKQFSVFRRHNSSLFFRKRLELFSLLGYNIAEKMQISNSKQERSLFFRFFSVFFSIYIDVCA